MDTCNDNSFDSFEMIDYDEIDKVLRSKIEQIEKLKENISVTEVKGVLIDKILNQIEDLEKVVSNSKISSVEIKKQLEKKEHENIQSNRSGNFLVSNGKRRSKELHKLRSTREDGNVEKLKEKILELDKQIESLRKENQKLVRKCQKSKEERQAYKLLKRVKYSISKDTFSKKKKEKLRTLFNLDEVCLQDDSTCLKDLSIEES